MSKRSNWWLAIPILGAAGAVVWYFFIRKSGMPEAPEIPWTAYDSTEYVPVIQSREETAEAVTSVTTTAAQPADPSNTLRQRTQGDFLRYGQALRFGCNQQYLTGEQMTALRNVANKIRSTGFTVQFVTTCGGLGEDNDVALAGVQNQLLYANLVEMGVPRSYLGFRSQGGRPECESTVVISIVSRRESVA